MEGRFASPRPSLQSLALALCLSTACITIESPPSHNHPTPHEIEPEPEPDAGKSTLDAARAVDGSEQDTDASTDEDSGTKGDAGLDATAPSEAADAGSDASEPESNDDAGSDASAPDQDDAGMDASTDSAPPSDDAGSDASTPDDDASVPPPPPLECQIFRAHSGDKTGKYKVGTATNKYVHAFFTNPWPGVRYGVLLRPVIDDSDVVRQISLYGAPVVSGKDGAIQTTTGSHPEGELLFTWAQGGGSLDFRELAGNAGFEFLQNQGFVLELHYHSASTLHVDASGVEVCVQAERPAEIAGVSWLGSENILLGSAAGTCAPTSQDPIQVLSVFPRMRAEGVHFTSIIKRAGGAEEVLHDADFKSDSHAWYAKDATLQPGDRINTSCTYGSASVLFGPGVNEEQCYMFSVATPKHALRDGKAMGTLLHGQGACLGL